MNALLLLCLLVGIILGFVGWLDYRRAKRRLDVAMKDYYQGMAATRQQLERQSKEMGRS